MIFIEHYPFKTKRTNVPKFVLNAKTDSQWFNLYKSELLAMWEQGNEYKFENKEAHELS